jgi:hypothetical protein
MITSIKYSELIRMAYCAGISIAEYLEELKKEYPEIKVIEDNKD